MRIQTQSHLSPNLRALQPKRNKCSSGRLSAAHRSQETLGLSRRKWMTSASLLVSQTMGKVERARDWPKVSSCDPFSFPDFTLPGNPRKELGKNLQRYPWGRQLEGRARQGCNGVVDYSINSNVEGR